MRITQTNLPTLNDSLPLALKSKYATQGFLDHLFGGGNDSGPGVTAVVGAGCDRSDWLSVLVDCIPQRLVLIDSLPEDYRKFEKSASWIDTLISHMDYVRVARDLGTSHRFPPKIVPSCSSALSMLFTAPCRRTLRIPKFRPFR